MAVACIRLRLSALCAAGVLALVAAACHRDNDEVTAGAQPVEALPQPVPVGGAVTGMPDTPGPGAVPLAGEPPPPPPLFAADERFGMPLLEDNPETGLGQAGDAAGPAAEPTVADATTLLRRYFAALATRDHARAYGMWSDGGRASGLTPEQFAAEHASTATLDAQVGEPGTIEAAAGSRMVEVPVLVRATQHDGSVRVLAGRVVLRRAEADGASAEQRAWRIASADLREAAD